MSIETILHEFIDTLYIKHSNNLPKQHITEQYIDVFISELDIKNQSRHPIINNKLESIESFKLGSAYEIRLKKTHIAHMTPINQEPVSEELNLLNSKLFK